MRKIVFFLLLPVFIFAQQDITAQLNAYMNSQSDIHEFSGAVLVAKGEKILYERAFGFANRECHVPNTMQSYFPIASLTKQFTAAAILRLEEQGNLKTSDLLSNYFPNFPKASKISIQMLLNHTSGIPDLLQEPAFYLTNPNILMKDIPQQTMLSIFQDKVFDFEPGTFWKYSNSGYLLLGYIIEKESGLPFRNFIKQQLLGPAKMSLTDFIKQDSITPNRTSGYSRTISGWRNSEIINFNIGYSMGGLGSTVVDLFKWQQALYSGKVLSDSAVAKMIHPNQGNYGAASGVFVENLHGHKTILHSGALAGFSSNMHWFPEEKITIIVLANRDTNLDFIPKGLAGILFGKQVKPTYKRNKTVVDEKILRSYAGTYQSEEIPYPLQLIARDNKLFLHLGRDIELTPESDTKFFIDEPDVEIQVEFTAGNLDRLHFIEGGVVHSASRA